MEKLNITKYLKDCPQGMKLNCLILDNLYFDKISEDKQSKYPIFCFTIDENGNRNSISFTENGCVTTRYGSKCVIFPEGKTTWEGFQRPFKDMDIIYNPGIEAISILKSNTLEESISYVFLNILGNLRVYHYHSSDLSDWRFATEEEKEKLFNAIKDNGYRWNAETKTLEKLPKFKVGDRIRDKKYHTEYNIINIENDKYVIEQCNNNFISRISVKCIDADSELVPNKFNISTLVPFESKVLVRDVDHYEWEGAIFGRYDGKKFFTIGGLDWGCCIPYEGNEHLFGTTDDCDDYYKVWKS